MKKLIAGLVLSSLLGLGLVTAPATADSWTWRDRGGTVRPLSIESIGAGHNANGPTVKITFDRPLRPSQMGPKDFIIVDIDSDGRGKSEEWLYLVSIRGRLTRFGYNPHSDTVAETHGSTWRRTRPRSVELSITPYAPGESHMIAVGSYTETAPGCGGGCWDVVPNRGRLIHDWTPPQIKAVTEPALWQFGPDLQFTWTALDTGLSGFLRSTLLRTTPGSGKWGVVQVRTSPGRYRLRIPLEQGDNVMLRPVVLDGARNKTLGPVRRVRVPYDQGNPNAPGTFTGMWTEEETEASYGGTIHTSTAPMDSMGFSGKGNLYCFLARWGPEPVRATFEAGGEVVEVDTFPAGGYSDGFPLCIPTETVEDRVATLTVHLGAVSIDGYWAGVAPEPATATRPRADRTSQTAGSHLARSMPPLRELKAGRARLSR